MTLENPILGHLVQVTDRAADELQRAAQIMKHLHHRVSNDGRLPSDHKELLQGVDSLLGSASRLINDDVVSAVRACALSEPVQLALTRGDVNALGALLRSGAVRDRTDGIVVDGRWHAFQAIAEPLLRAIELVEDQPMPRKNDG